LKAFIDSCNSDLGVLPGSRLRTLATRCCKRQNAGYFAFGRGPSCQKL